LSSGVGGQKIFPEGDLRRRLIYGKAVKLAFRVFPRWALA
jgi:hypothetical protein